MMRVFLFPGQGSQSIGLGQSYYEASPIAKEMFQIADDICGYSLSDLCFHGPDEKLKETRYSQPALYTVSYVAYSILKEKGITPDFVAGHSLGEYSALAASGAFDFATGLKLVCKRGQLMYDVGESVPGAMAAVLGLPAEEVRSLCEAVSYETKRVLVVANYNCPGQIVISGEKEAVQAAVSKLKEMKKKAIPLAVSGAFHSPLIQSANEEFKKVLEQTEFKNTSIPVVSNTTASGSCNGVELKTAVMSQMVSSVRWEESLNYLWQQGVKEYVETGSGVVLSGLVKKTLPEATIINTVDINAINQM